MVFQLPTVWDFLIPNLQTSTGIGILLIAGSVLAFWFGKPLFELLAVLGFPFKLEALLGIIFLLGVFMVWGVSYLTDFLSTSGGTIITWGIFSVIVAYLLLFWNPKKNKK